MKSCPLSTKDKRGTSIARRCVAVDVLSAKKQRLFAVVFIGRNVSFGLFSFCERGKKKDIKTTTTIIRKKLFLLRVYACIGPFHKLDPPTLPFSILTVI